ncbi:MAG: hypothetical protein NVS9B2_09030 [Steroidobacteraceae bacterium]
MTSIAVGVAATAVRFGSPVGGSGGVAAGCVGAARDGGSAAADCDTTPTHSRTNRQVLRRIGRVCHSGVGMVKQSTAMVSSGPKGATESFSTLTVYMSSGAGSL